MGGNFFAHKDSGSSCKTKSESSKISGSDHPVLCDTTCASQSWNGVYAGWCSVPYCKDDMRDTAEEQHQGFRLTAVILTQLKICGTRWYTNSSTSCSTKPCATTKGNLNEWNNVPQIFLHNYINSMRQRCLAVILENGGHIRY